VPQRTAQRLLTAAESDDGLRHGLGSV
jgi:hypothetical protein